MKYYTKELWKRVQKCDINAEKLWNKNADEYHQYYLKIKSSLPRKFIRIFEKEHGFHDYEVFEINLDDFLKGSHKQNVILKIENGINRYQIKLTDVTSCILNIIDKSNCINDKLCWGYTEIELLGDKIKLNMLCDVENELEFVFKNIKISAL